jgi:hypothetical protein
MFGNSAFAEVAFTDLTVGAAYSLTCSAGSYALTGNNATFTTNKNLNGVAGNYALTGNNATFTDDKKLSGATGSYALTGVNASFKINRNLTADAGAYGFTGSPILVVDGHKMIATSGTYNLTGYDASFTLDKAFSLGAGTYTFVGKDATLVYSNNGIITVTKGGISKSKVYKDLRQEVEDDIANAIAKVTGENIPPELEEISLEAEIKVAEEANIARLQERVMEAQALALQAEIDRLIQDELDDEESLMLLL